MKKTREDMIKVLIKRDIDMIKDGFANNDMEYLNNILMGNGWKQYNNLTDEEIRIEWEEDKSMCLECDELEYIDRDIQLCLGCIDKFDLEELWRLHDNNEIDALDFNESKSIRERFMVK